MTTPAPRATLVGAGLAEVQGFRGFGGLGALGVLFRDFGASIAF